MPDEQAYVVATDFPLVLADVVSSCGAIKLAALDCYQEEMRPWPHARSREAVEHLARWRGASVGTGAAEAFCLMRHVVPARSGA